MWLVILYLLFGDAQSGLSTVTGRIENVINERTTLIENEIKMMFGSDINLSDSEEKVNEIIMNLKHEELDIGFEEPQLFNVSKHFFEYKDEIKKSKLFQLIKQMPKGAILHAHDTGILSPDYVLQLTYWENLYVCFEGDDLRFLFSKSIPTDTCDSQWQLLRDTRFSSGDVEIFDAKLRKYFTLVIDKPNEVYTDINLVWNAFQNYFIRTTSLICYKPVWEQYFYDVLKALREENVMYIEIRSTLPELYDLDGNVFDSVVTAQSYKNVLDRFLVDYPDFYGAKLIYAPLRMVDASTVKNYIEIAKEIDYTIPGFLAGFDLVGQEDLGAPTKEFLEELVEGRKYLQYFFHAGETNWNGMSTDENLFDAIVLGTKRIGHAFALSKHPILIDEIKKRDIAIEVNVISNNVLKLVDDVRNHPLASFLAQNLPVVLSSDDPGIWEADILSHDFYVTFVGVASRHADLRLLKKLALNSLYYSTVKNKDKLVHEFEIRWTRFIDSVIKNSW
ncbi:adenosine deaminase 2-like [Galleria mellonella]|uniref:adenosine deaminase n=1 Tax=Galleria mellonella TaxID=7137 RepID=A0A6J1WWC4_GALME|nr:adenosine deaminase 2-like [Galleria mellonella]